MSTRAVPRPAPAPAGVPTLRDDQLPAVRFLTGAEAADVLRAPIEAGGGRLGSVTVRNVQYRPGSDLVVKYAAEVEWPGRAAKRETIMAGTRAAGSFVGAVPVAAVVNGRHLEVGVWRWPFDPVLVGLRAAVTTDSVAELCGIGDPTAVNVKVLAFRPTERAVARVTTPDETLFIKVVAPAAADALVARHLAAASAGVPVPRVRAAFADLGIVVFEELAGPLLKTHLKEGTGPLPSPAEFDGLADRIASIDTELPVAPSRVEHAVAHAAMLAGVDAACREPLERLVDVFSSYRPEEAPRPVHGDLHEGQIVTADGRITGLLDLDDLGVGSPLEERANVLGFLRYRALTLPAERRRITRYADELRSSSAARHDLDRLDTATAAVLVGLATGPFRIQQPGWRDTVRSVIALAADQLPARDSQQSSSGRPHLNQSQPTPTEEP